MKRIAKNEMQTIWQLVNPEPFIQPETHMVNAHPLTLAGKTVVLYWNGKPNGDLFLNEIADLLKSNIDNVKVIKAWEVFPASNQTDPTIEASRAVAKSMAGLKPDVVIGAPGDCTGSATWLIMDQLNMERLGIPTVTIVTSPFLELSGTVPQSEGFSEACIVQVSPPVGMLTVSEIQKKAADAFDEILTAATNWKAAAIDSVKRESYPADIFEFTGTIEEINRYFIDKKWSLGLPILPPTPDRVDDLLKGTGRKPDEILGQVPPTMGSLTVELVAVYAAMAGCRPQYMPVLIAALEGFLAPEMNWRLALSGTGTSQMLVIVNGPIVKEIGIGCEQGAAGKGFHANGSIGYAINLIAYAVGGSRPPSFDRSTFASPADYVCWVFGENENALPEGWDPLHVERGHKSTNSVVTVMVSYPPIENMDHWSKSAEEHMRWWSYIVSPLHNMGGPSIPQIMNQNPIIALGPEHAHLIASMKWSKDDFRKAFWEQTRIPLSAWPHTGGLERLAEMLGPVSDDSYIPIALKPENFLIVIAGGDGKQSHYFAPIPGSFPVSRLI